MKPGEAGKLIAASVVLLALVTGCASSIEGSVQPPLDWVADAPPGECAALSGTYSTAGMPAPGNAHAVGYGAVWPTEGSLLSIIERGTNASPRKRPRMDPEVAADEIVPSMSILVDESGKATFKARTASGKAEKLEPKVWTCEGGSLTSLASLSTENFESHVRLWKHGSVLVAEQTIRETNGHAAGARAHRPVARFHFRFASTAE